MDCDAAIRPFPDDTEVRCTRSDDHTVHSGPVRDYAYPGSVTILEWDDLDRRSFHGEWRGYCGQGGCMFPFGHRGRHDHEVDD